MSKADRPVLLVGGVPGLEVPEVLNTVAPILGDIAFGLTDGEVGGRRLWIISVMYELWHRHLEVEVVRESEGVAEFPDGILPPEWRHVVPAGYHDLPWFRPRRTVTKLSTADYTTGYPGYAASSYKIFCELRDKGLIPAGVRFQQCIPFPEDAVRTCTPDADAMDMLVDAYIEIVKQDVEKLCETIPHDDLLLQWDVNWETIAIEHGDHLPETPPMQYKPHGDPWDRFVRYIRELNAAVPETVPLGMHLCYGNLHHRHFKDPADLKASVEMANRAVAESPRALQYFHMAVPRHRDDDAYFAPLESLDIGDTTVYAGLVHYTDGVEGSVNRLQTLKRHYDGQIGVATECGLAHRPPDQELVRLLEIHRDVAAAI